MMKTRGKILAGLACALLLAGCASQPAPEADAFFDVPRVGPTALDAVGKLPPVIDESSGLAASGRVPGVFWTHNDSGDAARIFAISDTGEMVSPGDKGVAVVGAVNRDWEEIAGDFRGNLLIGAFGNNANRRTDLAIYQVPEPDPFTATRVEPTARWPIVYPDQTEFPPANNNFDCEAMFVASGELYLITKHRADTMATLYRLDSRETKTSNKLTLLQRANLRGMVTAASSWNDGERVAVLTYGNVWLFEPANRNGNMLFDAPARWLPIRAHQAEAVAFLDRETLIITNEQRGVFHLPISSMHEVTLR
ncbi:MAG: hypothetical protein ACQKBV_08840 [Puniceicoccales bacterium]